jgi:hypothetical protein
VDIFVKNAIEEEKDPKGTQNLVMNLLIDNVSAANLHRLVPCGLSTKVSLVSIYVNLVILNRVDWFPQRILEFVVIVEPKIRRVGTIVPKRVIFVENVIEKNT